MTNILEMFPELTYLDIKEYNPTAVIEFDRTGSSTGAYSTTLEQTSPIKLFNNTAFIYDSFELSGDIPKEVFEAISKPQLVNGNYLAPNFNLVSSQDGFPIGNSRISYGSYGQKPIGIATYDHSSKDDNDLNIIHDPRIDFSEVPLSLNYDMDKFYLYLRFNIYTTRKKKFIDKYFTEGGQISIDRKGR